MRRFPEELYEIAANEVAQRNVVRSVMAKAFSDAGGDEKKAIAYYMEYRAAQLAQEAREDVRRKRRAAAHATKQQAVSSFRPAAAAVLGVVTLIFAALALVLLIMGVNELVDPNTPDALAPLRLTILSFLMATSCGVCGFFTYKVFKNVRTRQ
jgi:hypothetical protein